MNPISDSILNPILKPNIEPNIEPWRRDIQEIQSVVHKNTLSLLPAGKCSTYWILPGSAGRSHLFHINSDFLLKNFLIYKNVVNNLEPGRSLLSQSSIQKYLWFTNNYCIFLNLYFKLFVLDCKFWIKFKSSSVKYDK